ncbi:MAG: hypothetical protein FJX77_05775 [Armatimonadetes bacterium]|nr:hypothetical protein [Armatimonadota bacterium]
MTPLTVREAQLFGISLLPTNVVSKATGPPVDLLIRLTSPAPAGGAVVALTSSNRAVLQVPRDVTVPEGQDRVALRLSPKKAGSATITATWKGISRTTVLTVNP